MKKLYNIEMKDGSRHFGDIPQLVGYSEFRDHVSKLAGAVETAFVTDNVTEMWLDLTFRSHNFSVNDQMGEYWFFVDDPGCPDDILETILNHFQELARP